jgi:hypothetical protein
VNGRYLKIIGLPHHTSRERQGMSPTSRAAQFAPFAALSGFESEICERGRITERMMELDEIEIERLNRVLCELIYCKPDALAEITFFKKDERKDGGKYVCLRGTVKEFDSYERRIILTDGSAIPIELVVRIEEVVDESEK